MRLARGDPLGNSCANSGELRKLALRQKSRQHDAKEDLGRTWLDNTNQHALHQCHVRAASAPLHHKWNLVVLKRR